MGFVECTFFEVVLFAFRLLRSLIPLGSFLSFAKNGLGSVRFRVDHRGILFAYLAKGSGFSENRLRTVLGAALRLPS